MREYREDNIDWRDKAACVGVDDPELFFPVGDGRLAKEQAERAKRICGGCAVRGSCLDWAMENNQDSGVWGGLDEQERRQLKRAQRRYRK